MHQAGQPGPNPGPSSRQTSAMHLGPVTQHLCRVQGSYGPLSHAPLVEQGGKLLEIPHSGSCTRSVTAEKHSTADPAEDKLKHKSHWQQVAVQQH